MIKLQVIGHLGKDCIVNNVNGKNVINFSVAHTEKYKDAQGVQKDKTLWVECAYWTDRTAIAPYLKKGQLVFAEGTPDMKTYTTNDGKQGASLTLRISMVQLIGGRTDNQGSDIGGGSYSQQQPSHNQQSSSQQSYNQPAPQPGGSAGEINEPIDDLPF